MEPNNYAMPEQWYKEHPDPKFDNIVYEGLGISSADFSSLKINAVNKYDKIFPAKYKGLRMADTDKVNDIVNKVVANLDMIDRTKAPPQWFTLAAVRIAKTARNTVERKGRQNKDSTNRSTQDASRDDGDKKAPQTTAIHTGEQLDGHGREWKRKRSGSVCSTEDRSPPSKLARRDWPPIIVGITGEDTSQLIEPSSIIDSGTGQPSFGAFTAALSSLAALSGLADNFARATYKGQFGRFKVAVCNDATLQRVMDWARDKNSNEVEIVAEIASVQPQSIYQIPSTPTPHTSQSSSRDIHTRIQHSVSIPLRPSPRSPSLGQLTRKRNATPPFADSLDSDESTVHQSIELRSKIKDATMRNIDDATMRNIDDDDGTGSKIKDVGISNIDDDDGTGSKTEDAGMSDTNDDDDGTGSKIKDAGMSDIDDDDGTGSKIKDVGISNIDDDDGTGSKTEDAGMSYIDDNSESLYDEPSPLGCQNQCAPEINNTPTIERTHVSREPGGSSFNGRAVNSTGESSNPLGGEPPQHQNEGDVQISKDAKDEVNMNGPLGYFSSYQGGQINKYQPGEAEREKINIIANQDTLSNNNGEDTEQVDEEEALYQKYQDKINQSLNGQLARQTIENIRGVCSWFNLKESSFTSSSDRIPIDSRWLLNPTASLSPHQWQLVYEMLKQEVRLGGGIVGDPPGVGKTHPTLFKSYVNFFILRLRYQVKIDRGLLLTTRHIITEPHLQQPSETCPSQPMLPIPCPCKVGNWTHDHHIPPGAAIYITMPNIMKSTLRVIQNLFDNARIFTVDPIDDLPLRIAVAHSGTQSGSRKEKTLNPNLIEHYTTDLTSAELAELCRIHDWSRVELKIPKSATKIQRPTFPTGLMPPSGLSSGVSDHAGRYLIVTTMASLPGQILNKTTINASWKEKGKPDIKKSENQYALVLREMYVDEGHNNFASSNLTMKRLRTYRTQLEKHQLEFMRYWMGSGTARQAGLIVPVNHIATMLSRDTWSTNSEDTENGFLTVDMKEWLGRLCYKPSNPIADKTPPFQKLLAEWNDLVRDATANLNGTEGDSSKDHPRQTYQKKFQEHINISAKIFMAFLIERSHDTKRIDGGALLPTANIKVASRVTPVHYSQNDAHYIQQLFADIKKLIIANLGERVAKWEQNGEKGPKPTRIITWQIKGYQNVVIASTTPNLARSLKQNPELLDNMKGLQSIHIRAWWDDPLNCPLYRNFDTFIQGDMKWVELKKIIKAVQATPKSTGSRSKLIIGLRLPVVALLYYCGLLRVLKQSTLDRTDISKCPVTAVHSGIGLPDRMPHFDAFNDDQSETQFLVTTIELIAEGVTLIGANYVVVIDPHPKLDKTIQFCGRPCRLGQTETVYVTQLYNEDSPIDASIIQKQLFTQDISSKVGDVKVQDIEDGKGKQATCDNRDKGKQAMRDDEDEVQITGYNTIPRSYPQTSKIVDDYI